MPGAICLAGGGEFLAPCRAMDEAVLARAGAGPVVVAPLGSSPGLDYRAAGAQGRRWFASLGVSEIRVAPDVRDDPDGAVRAIADAALLVLPGGSPARLLDALTTTPMGAAVAAMSERGAVVAGASAGAMVLGGWTLLPEGYGPDGPPLVEALGLVPGVVVLPHFRGDRGWIEEVRRRLGATPLVLGLPECAGVLVDGVRVTAVGATPVTVCGAADRVLAVGESWCRGA